MTTRADFLKMAGGAAAGVMLMGAGRRAPRVIIFFLDDMPMYMVNELPQAKRWLPVIGTRAYVPDPLCTPTRVSFQLGQYPSTHGITANDPGLGEFIAMGYPVDALGPRLKAQGWRTGFFGKSMNGQESRERYQLPGWDNWTIMTGDLNRDDVFKVNDNGNIRVIERRDWNETAFFTNQIRDMVLNLDPDVPAVILASYHAPHGPYHARESNMPDGASLDKPNFNHHDDGKPPWIRNLEPCGSDAEKAKMREDKKGKIGEVGDVDDGIQRIMAALSATEQLPQTYAFLFADNGYFFGEHRIQDGKGHPYEQSSRTPFLARGPGFVAGPNDALISVIDVTATIAEIAGSDTSGYEGQSLLPVMRDLVSPWRSDLLVEHRAGHGYDMLRTNQYVYVEHETGERELYNMHADNYQLRSLQRTADPALLTELSGRLAGLKA